MHKAVMCIVKADDADNAKSKVEEFLEGYGDGKVWDWYTVGGRFSGLLNHLSEKFKTAANKFLVKKYNLDPKNPFLTQKHIDDCADDLKALWEKMGGKGKNPYARDSYRDDAGDDDILPLSECASVVKKWKRDLIKEANKAFRQLCIERKKEVEARKKGEKHISTMSGYYAGIYKEAVYDEFCFDSNTFDIDAGTNDPTQALAEPDDRWVVLIDMHN